MAVESPLPDGPLCDRDHFTYVTILREPLARGVSHAAELLRWGLVPRRNCSSYPFLRAAFPALYDNYHVRMLAGEAAYREPAGAMTRAHLARARRVLARFALVLRFGPAALVHARARLGLAASAAAWATEHPVPRSCNFTEADRSRFKRDNALDEELFASAPFVEDRGATLAVGDAAASRARRGDKVAPIVT